MGVLGCGKSSEMLSRSMSRMLCSLVGDCMGSGSWNGLGSIGAVKVEVWRSSKSTSGMLCSLVGVAGSGSSRIGVGSVGAVEVKVWRSEGTAMTVDTISVPAAEGSGSLETCCITAEVG